MTRGKVFVALFIGLYLTAAWGTAAAMWWTAIAFGPAAGFRFGLTAIGALCATVIAVWFTLFFAAMGGFSWTR